MNSIHTLFPSAAIMTVDSSQSRHQTLKVQAVRNSQVSPKQNESSAIRRTLDAYGIDDNRQTLSQVNQGKYHVLIKQDKSGVADLAHGVFISKQHEDNYGSFRWLNPRGLQKYQTNDLVQVTLTTKKLGTAPGYVQK